MDIQREYRDMCQKLTETLMKDEMTAIMVQLGIDRATRGKVTEGRKFIDVLEMRELIGVGNFRRLIPLLKDHELDHMADLLEKYMADYKKADELDETSSITTNKIAVETENTNKEHSINTEAKAVPSIKISDICGEHKAPEEVICLVCYKKLCYACAYMFHQDHQVVSMDDLAAKVQDEIKAVQCVFETLEKEKIALDNGIMVLEEKIQSPMEYNLQTFVEEGVEVIRAIQEKSTNSIKEATQLGVTYLKHITTVLSKVDNAIFLTEEEIGAKLYHDVFTQLLELNKRERKMQGNKNEINKISQQINDGSMEISIRPTSISGDIARVVHGCVLGAVMANAEQMVVIRSQGNPSKFLKVSCTACFDPSILYWDYTFKCEQTPYPLVLGNTLHIAPQKIEIVVGCGSKLVIFQVDEKKGRLYFVKKTTTNVDIPNGSHITGLSSITGKMQDRGVILSDESSGILKILDNNFKIIKNVKYPGNFQMITCVFRENVYKCAVTCPNSQSVDLLKTNPDEEIPRKFGKLKVQNTNLHPQSLFFDGTFFTVLWVSGEETYNRGQKWKVVAYKDDGEECNVCKEGNCEPNITAVSISHVKNDTLLCFSNGSFDLFQTFTI